MADGAVLVQAKGHTYTIDELVVDEDRARELHGGTYATIYLSPRDYHRVHAPIDARLVAYDYVPGALWPVNPKVASRRDRLFTRNERVVIWLQSERIGMCAVVMVGASGVGNIELAHMGQSSAFRARGERRRIELDEPVRRGDDLGAFRLGSTVVLVTPPGTAHCEVGEGQVVRFGERIGELS
jgi:phosphatidylserine decarboxylase